MVENTEIPYYKFRLLKGIAEGVEIVKRLPSSFNLDFLNGISFKKGIYHIFLNI